MTDLQKWKEFLTSFGVGYEIKIQGAPHPPCIIISIDNKPYEEWKVVAYHDPGVGIAFLPDESFAEIGHEE